MAEESTSSKKNLSAANAPSTKSTKSTATISARQSKLMSSVGHFMAATWAVAAGILTTSNIEPSKFMELQGRSLFFQLRGSQEPPEDIVILEIDNQSVTLPQQLYKQDPQKYAALKPLQNFPFKRGAYAQVIDKLMSAGARSVSVDVLFDSISNEIYTENQKLDQALQRYPGKVVLASLYESSSVNPGLELDTMTRLTKPNSELNLDSVHIGSTNFPLEVDGKIHRLAREYPKILAEKAKKAEQINLGLKQLIESLTENLSFEEASLKASGVNYPSPKGDSIYFWGPGNDFQRYKFMDVLDPDAWNNNLNQGKVFKDKIVLIGLTDARTEKGKDSFNVAGNSWFEANQMVGVEVHANAIATLMTGKSISEGIPNPFLRGLFVLVVVGSTAIVITRSKKGVKRFLSSLVIAVVWGSVGYICFIHGLVFVPTAIPVVAMICCGLSYLATEVVREKLSKSQLMDLFRQNLSHRVVQEIISQQDDLKDLLRQREIEISGKILDGRYQIIKVLGYGGFSETYVAEDRKRPGNPQCVVKQLKPSGNKPEGLDVARRLFNSEAQTLEQLGKHSQIPQLLAYFEEDEEFYLVQEYILGHPLNQELPTGKIVDETIVVNILVDLLQTLNFVHQNYVIHRDIKPSNIIRREGDGKLVLIDFGAVKEVTGEFDILEETAYTIGIGTKGYAPTEQCLGRPQYSSDIYAVGMIAIKALTGISPHDINMDENGEWSWVHKANVSPQLAKIISKMVRNDFLNRYQIVTDVLTDLNGLDDNSFSDDVITDYHLSLDESDVQTTPWSG
jgi:serine/threonine protein kinase/CHASE2 domain-containing sensor protein